MEVVASLSQGRTAAAQCGLFTYKSVPVIFKPPCKSISLLEHPACVHCLTVEMRLFLSICETLESYLNPIKLNVINFQEKK